MLSSPVWRVTTSHHELGMSVSTAHNWMTRFDRLDLAAQLWRRRGVGRRLPRSKCRQRRLFLH